jgi:hypothetical protein
VVDKKGVSDRPLAREFQGERGISGGRATRVRGRVGELLVGRRNRKNQGRERETQRHAYLRIEE